MLNIGDDVLCIKGQDVWIKNPFIMPFVKHRVKTGNQYKIRNIDFKYKGVYLYGIINDIIEIDGKKVEVSYDEKRFIKLWNNRDLMKQKNNVVKKEKIKG